MSKSNQQKTLSSLSAKRISVRNLKICLFLTGIIFLTQCNHKLQKTWIISEALARVEFSTDNKVVIGGLNKNTIGFVEARTGKLLHKFQIPFSNVRSITFSKDGSLMAVGGGETFGKGMFSVWNFQLNKTVQGITFEQEVDSLDFSPGNNFLAFTASDKSVHILDIKTGNVENLNGHTGEVISLGYSPDGNLIASGSADKTIRLWNTKTKETVQVLSDCGADFAFSPDGKLLVAGDGEIGAIKIFEVETGKGIKTLSWTTDKYNINKILFLSNSNTIAVGGGIDLAKPGEIRIYNLENGEIKQLIKEHRGIVTDLTYNPSDSILISSGAVVEDSNTVYGEIKVWSISGL